MDDFVNSFNTGKDYLIEIFKNYEVKTVIIPTTCMPVAWRLSDGKSGSFSNEAPFQATLSINEKGEMRLYITYSEEIFDEIDWQETGQAHEVEEVIFKIE